MESIHSKIFKLIHKAKLSLNDFINLMKNILTYNEIKKQNIIRKDYIAKTLAKISLELEDNNLEWLKYDQLISELEDKIGNLN